MKMMAAVARAHDKPVSVEEIRPAPPKANEVCVKTAYTGLCHSDLSMVRGVFDMPLPLVLGHEASGVVETVGPDVRTVSKGDHVVVTWHVACGHCPECRKGLRNVCRSSFVPHSAGALLDMTSRLADSKGNRLNHQTNVSGFAEYMVVPEAAAVRIRKDLPLDQASLIGCCVPTGFGAVYNAAGVKPGNSAAIWGMGGVGLNVVNGARLRGANPIFGIDLEGSKETLARELGVTNFINSAKEDPVPIHQGTHGRWCGLLFRGYRRSGSNRAGLLVVRHGWHTHNYRKHR